MSEENLNDRNDLGDLDEFLDELPESMDMETLLGVSARRATASDAEAFFDDEDLGEFEDDFLDDLPEGREIASVLGQTYSEPCRDEETGDLLGSLPEEAALQALLAGNGHGDFDAGAVENVLSLLTDQSKLAALIQTLSTRHGASTEQPEADAQVASEPLAAAELPRDAGASSGPLIVGSVPVQSFLRGIDWSGKGRNMRTNRTVTPAPQAVERASVRSGSAPAAPSTGVIVGSLAVSDFLPAVNWSGKAQPRRNPSSRPTPQPARQTSPTIEW
ncbi:hypothetical protein Poly30_01030 [Planctomycetes bacterium Poly30]|uniref:Uncharacterized protein n=1 Tax=Saltatorellus ferox TaxID=2528018 RepID=A0A518EKJ6_9BACT|nr:hypothetical protein Poly30_01030 [Planctomycetes bacterium Poly30]